MVASRWLQAHNKASASAYKHKIALEDSLGTLLFSHAFPTGQKLLFIRTPLS
jgi:hypothetical protein